MTNIDTKTVEYTSKLQIELDKLKSAISREDFETQFYISGEIERIAMEFRKYQVEISDSK